MKKIVITGGLGYLGTELCKLYSGETRNNNIVVSRDAKVPGAFLIFPIPTKVTNKKFSLLIIFIY